MKHWIEFTQPGGGGGLDVAEKKRKCNKRKNLDTSHNTTHTRRQHLARRKSLSQLPDTFTLRFSLSAPQVIYIYQTTHIERCREFVDHSSRRLAAKKNKFALFSCRDFFLSLFAQFKWKIQVVSVTSQRTILTYDKSFLLFFSLFFFSLIQPVEADEMFMAARRRKQSRYISTTITSHWNFMNSPIRARIFIINFLFFSFRIFFFWRFITLKIINGKFIDFSNFSDRSRAAFSID